MGARWTAGVDVQESSGRLTVQFDRKPSEDEMKRVEEEANRCIQRNQAVYVVEMERKEAERQFGDLIYDLFPIPSHITRLRIAQIEGWNINCCNKEHTKTTGEVGVIRLRDLRFRANKQLLEISFDVLYKWT